MMSLQRPTHPFVSVIVPAHQAAAVLPKCLTALTASTLPRDYWELVVVDDGSRDETALIAAQYADTVVRLAGNPHGPAYARNRGCDASRGDILVFVDSDVCVHPDALERFANIFASDATLSAAFGSYDPNPPSPGLVSQYRNLLHHYVHQQSAGEAETFWAGLGAIRRRVFAEAGMFDEWAYAHPQIEDIELGRRLRNLGRRILLMPQVQGTHLKRWTLRNMITTDFQHRGVPWMWLLLKEGPQSAHPLNIRLIERLCTMAAGAAGLATLLAIALREPGLLWIAALGIAAILVSNLGFYRFLDRHRGTGFTLGVIPLHVMYYGSNVLAVFSGWLVHVLFGEPRPSVEAETLANTQAKVWPPPPRQSLPSTWREPERRGGSDVR